MYINKIVFSDGSEKEFSDPGTRAMKETTAYMMTEMMETVLAYGTDLVLTYHGFHKQVRQGTSNYTDDEIENYIKKHWLCSPRRNVCWLYS